MHAVPRLIACSLEAVPSWGQLALCMRCPRAAPQGLSCSVHACSCRRFWRDGRATALPSGASCLMLWRSRRMLGTGRGWRPACGARCSWCSRRPALAARTATHARAVQPLLVQRQKMKRIRTWRCHLSARQAASQSRTQCLLTFAFHVRCLLSGCRNMRSVSHGHPSHSPTPLPLPIRSGRPPHACRQRRAACGQLGRRAHKKAGANLLPLHPSARYVNALHQGCVAVRHMSNGREGTHGHYPGTRCSCVCARQRHAGMLNQ